MKINIDIFQPVFQANLAMVVCMHHVGDKFVTTLFPGRVKSSFQTAEVTGLAGTAAEAAAHLRM